MSDKYLKIFKNNVNRRKEELKIDQKALAVILKVKPSAVSRDLNGKHGPTINKIAAYAKALETTPGKLLTDPTELPSHEPGNVELLKAMDRMQTAIIQLETQIQELKGKAASPSTKGKPTAEEYAEHEENMKKARAIIARETSAAAKKRTGS